MLISAPSSARAYSALVSAGRSSMKEASLVRLARLRIEVRWAFNSFCCGMMKLVGGEP
jgi:hypothetical protein